MSHYFIPKQKSLFTFLLWTRWIILSLIGWGTLFGSVILIFFYTDNLYIFPMFFVGLIVIGCLQWINIRGLFSWSNLWIRATLIGIPLGIIYVIILAAIIGPAGLGIGLIIDNFFGVMPGIVSTAVTVSLCFVIVTHYNGKLTKRITERVSGKRLLILEQVVIIKDATSTAIILSAIFILANVIVGIIVGGLTFALLTGFGVKEIGVPMIKGNTGSVDPQI